MTRAAIAKKGTILESLDGTRRVEVVEVGHVMIRPYVLRNLETGRISKVEWANLPNHYRFAEVER